MIKAFNRWEMDHIKVDDLGLVDVICLKPRIVPKTGGRARGRFHKSSVFLPERLMNRMMVTGHKGKKHVRSSGHFTGMKEQAYRIVEKALLLVEATLKRNPMEVLVKAVENGAPREEVITIEYGGAMYPKSVEVSPHRRVDMALKMIALGAYDKSFNSKTVVERALADEIMAAYKVSVKSAAISKKRDLERQASSSK